MIFGFDAAASLTIDEATAEHYRPMADIHAAAFARAWTDGEIEQLLGKPGTLGLVLRKPKSEGGKLVGFIMSRTVIDETEVLTIAVKPNWQGYGCGRRLMDACLERAHRERVKSIFLEVDENNKAATKLYKKLGFAAIAERPGYYLNADGSRGKALVMRRDFA